MISTSDAPARQPDALRTKLLRRVRSPTFASDVVLVLAFRLVLLVALKFAFFNHPEAANMSMPPAEVAQAILSVSAPNMR